MAKDDRRLGKGLAALLGENFDADDRTGVEGEVELGRIRPNPFQPRSEFDDEAIERLAGSIHENGLLQPIVVRPVGEAFQIVAGERRFRAIQRLGWDRVPVITRGLSDEQMLVVALVENLQREDLSPLEEALGYQRLVEDFDLSHQEVAERVGKDRSTVANALRLLALPDEVRGLLAAGRISAGHGRAILGVEEAASRIELARRVAEEGWSVRETERRVRALRDGDGAAAPRGREESAPEADGRRERGDPVARRAVRLLERALGTQVRVRDGAGDGGELVIAYHGAEDFERLVRLIAGDAAEELFGGP